MRIHHDYDKWYGQAYWRKSLKPTILARDPVCCHCKRAPSVVADHIKPHRGDRALFCDMKNLQGLCTRCHNKKTASEDGGFGNAPQQQRPAAPLTAQPNFGGMAGTTTSVGADAIDAALAGLI